MNTGNGSATDGMRKEVRVALVLNGGVSLAIWMGGVTHELNLVRLASRDADFSDAAENNAAAENAVVQVWKKILELSKRRVEVDIVAGTSAGGLNGALLATAIARGTNLPHMKQKWAGLADLADLANQDDRVVTSLLNGDYFEEKIEDLLAHIAQSPSSRQLEGDCTLLITATALGARARTRLLERNQTRPVVDSRRVYRFVHRRKEPSPGDDELGDSDFDDLETLRCAARASASFPVAFEQVQESLNLYARRVSAHPADDPGQQLSWLMDGGVLDNAPFEPLLDALLSRPVSAPFERTLLYVTPSVGDPASPLSGAQLPDISAVVSGLLAAVREPDQRLDDDALRAAFRLMGYAVSQPHAAIQEFLTSPQSSPTCYLAAAASLFPYYQRGRNEALEREFAELGNPAGAVWQIPAPATMSTLRPGIPEEFAQPDSQWTYGLPVADRILRWWGRALVAAIAATDTVVDKPKAQKALRALARAQREISELKAQYDLVAQATDQEVLTEPVQITARQDFYQARAAEIQTTVQDIAAQVAACLPGIGPAELIEFSLAVEIVSSVHSWGSSRYDVPPFRYLNLTPAATPIVAGLRILEGHDSWPKNKLQGERLQHFGAFAVETGRRYDWTWGRLDGASALFDQIMSEQLASADSKDRQRCRDLRQELADAIMAAEGRTAGDLCAETERVLGSGPYDILAQMPERNKTFQVLHRNAQALVRNSAMSAPFKFGINRLIGITVYCATKLLAVYIARAKLKNRVRGIGTWLRRVFRRKPKTLCS